MFFTQKTTSKNSAVLSIGGMLLLMVTIEAAFLASGRIAQIGPLTLKMWLYLFAQVYVFYRIANGATFRRSTLILLGTFCFLLFFGTLVGLSRNAEMIYLGGDISPYLYMLMLLFCELTICDVTRLRLVVKVIETAAVVIPTLLIIILFLLLIGKISFVTLYRFMTHIDPEFTFRGASGAIDYKGMIYVAVGSLFFLYEKGRIQKVLGVVAMLIVLSTLTRGLWIGLVVVGILHLITGKQALMKKIVILIVGCLVILGFASYSSFLAKNRKSSDEVRVVTLEQVNERITPVTLFFGHGLGEGVPIRPGHMEIMYAEIFYTQGLLGVAWWLGSFYLVIRRYLAARKNYALAQPLMMGIVFVYVASAVNPWIGNPIGMFILAAGLAGLAVLDDGNRPSTPHAGLKSGMYAAPLLGNPPPGIS